MKEDNFFLGQLADKIDQCENKYITTYTNFMDGHQQSIARIYCRKNFIPATDGDPYKPEDMGSIPPTRSIFYGGYDDAERVILINLPDYAFLEAEEPLTVIRATKAEGSRELTHRDYPSNSEPVDGWNRCGRNFSELCQRRPCSSVRYKQTGCSGLRYKHQDSKQQFLTGKR